MSPRATDPSAWLQGWSRTLREEQRAAARATPQSDWWSAGVAPILDLQGDQDPFKPIEKRFELRDELGERVTVKIVPGASHALLVEQPDAVADALAEWIATLKA